MSINSILASSTSGLAAAQTAINAVSDNVSNVNTPGYSEKVVNLSTEALQGVGVGVDVLGVTLAANQFLQNASLSAAAQSAQASAVSNLLGQAQAYLGDPSSTTGLFGSLNQMFSDFAAAANDPASALNASKAVSDVQGFLGQAQTAAGQISTLEGQADTQISSDVATANQYLSQISALNATIATESASGGDATDAQNAQNELISKLSSFMDLKVSTNANGTTSLTTASGTPLVGIGGAAALGYSANGATGALTITQPGANQPAVALPIQSGELLGLLGLRNTTLPGVSDQLSELVSGVTSAVNAASNASTAFPPPAKLTGSATGVDLATAIGGFAGTTNIAVVNATGALQTSVQINFTAGTMTAGSGSPVSFTPATFLSTLNTALGGAATASYANGALSLTAAGSGNGIAIADSATSPSSRNGEGFSQYFGLNNLISSSTVTNYATGLTASDPSNFPAGQTLKLQINGANGNQITDVTISTPGGTVQSLLNALNANPGGVGLYGQFTLDSTGALAFTPTTPGSASVSVVSDGTSSSSGGMSVSQLFGIGAGVRAQRTQGLAVRSDIVANPALLQLGTLNLSAAASGQPVLSAGDGTGGQLLAQANASTIGFGAAGDLAAMTTSVTNYASVFAGKVGNDASAASQAATIAQSVQTEATSRLQSATGVSLDQELIHLSTYQQAYSASARLVTAAKDMFSTLMSMVG